MSNVAHIYGSCHTHDAFESRYRGGAGVFVFLSAENPAKMSHGTHMDESCQPKRLVTCMNASCHTCA